MPSQEGFRCDDPCQITQAAKPEDLPFNGQSTSLIVVEQNPFLADDLPQNLILGPQIFDRLLLTAVDPSRDSDQQELPRM